MLGGAGERDMGGLDAIGLVLDDVAHLVLSAGADAVHDPDEHDENDRGPERYPDQPVPGRENGVAQRQAGHQIGTGRTASLTREPPRTRLREAREWLRQGFDTIAGCLEIIREPMRNGGFGNACDH
jgi:hypothetical protein